MLGALSPGSKPKMERMYDMIGDIHGHADELIQPLGVLGYLTWYTQPIAGEEITSMLSPNIHACRWF
jgi:hypothetical protein